MKRTAHCRLFFMVQGRGIFYTKEGDFFVFRGKTEGFLGKIQKILRAREKTFVKRCTFFEMCGIMVK